MTDAHGELEHPEAGRVPGHPPDGQTRPGGALERRRSSELTPVERAQQKRNRRLMLTIAIPAFFLGVGALAASILADAGAPTPHPLFVPAGYHAVGDGVFSYAVPNSWSKNDAYSDDAGDLETSGRSGWVGDHLTARPTAPDASDPPPQVFQSFGQDRPSAFNTSTGTAVHVSGSTVAYRYTITRPGGFSATAVDAWQSSSGAQLWLIIDADPQVTDQILATLKA